MVANADEKDGNESFGGCNRSFCAERLGQEIQMEPDKDKKDCVPASYYWWKALESLFPHTTTLLVPVLL
jgi:hypothetical protein